MECMDLTTRTTPILPIDSEYDAIKKYCLNTIIPDELCRIAYSMDLHADPNVKRPPFIRQIQFAELLERLESEVFCYAWNGLHEQRACAEQAIACVKLVAWLLEHGHV